MIWFSLLLPLSSSSIDDGWILFAYRNDVHWDSNNKDVSLCVCKKIPPFLGCCSLKKKYLTKVISS